MKKILFIFICFICLTVLFACSASESNRKDTIDCTSTRELTDVLIEEHLSAINTDYVILTEAINITPSDRHRFVTIYTYTVTNAYGNTETRTYGYETKTDENGNVTLIRKGEDVNVNILLYD